MKSYEETKDSNEREKSPEPSPEYPEEVSFVFKNNKEMGYFCGHEKANRSINK